MLGDIEVNPSSLQIPISTVVLTKSPLMWSNDNIIILTTQHKLLILELECSTQSSCIDLQFKRYALDTPEITNKYIPSGPEYLKCIKNGGTKTINKQTLPYFTTASRRAELTVAVDRLSKPSQISGDLCHHGYRKTVSSELNMSKNKGCLFCTLTYDHKLMVVAKVYDCFKVIYDLSGIWNQYIKNHNQLQDDTQIYKCRHKLTQFVHIQCFYDILWTPTYRDDKGYYSFILTITGTGYAVAFKIPGDGYASQEVYVHNCCSCDFTDVSATCFLPYQPLEVGMLVLASTDGKISLYKVNFDHEFFISFVGKVEPLSRSPISHVFLHQLMHDKYLLLVSRSCVLMAYILHIQDDGITTVANTYDCGRFNITETQFMDIHTIYATLCTGAVVKYKFEYTPSYDTISIKKEVLFQSEQVSFSGFAQSPNKCLWAIFETISVPYDHLVIRSASSVQVFGVNKPETLYKFALKDMSVPIQGKGDVMENIRLYTSRGLFNSLLDLLLQENIDLGSYDYLQNFIALAMICSHTIAEEKKLDKFKSLIKLTKDVQIALFDQWIRSIKSKMNLSNSEATKILDEITLIPLIKDNMDDTQESKFCMICRKQFENKSTSDFCHLCIQSIDEPMSERNFMPFCTNCHLTYPITFYLETNQENCIYCNRALTSINDIPPFIKQVKGES